MPNDDIPRRNILTTAVTIEGGLGVAALLLGWLLGQPPLPTIQWTGDGIAWGLLATLPLLGLLVLCVKAPFGALRKLLHLVDGLLVPLFRNCRLIDLVLISILAGFGEEMLFRGVLQPAVAHWIGGPIGVVIGLLSAAVLFGLAHAITVTYAVLATIIGVYLGATWVATDNLLVPILAHGLYDFVALVYLVRFRR
jgi:uncharacterized protein